MRQACLHLPKWQASPPATRAHQPLLHKLCGRLLGDGCHPPLLLGCGRCLPLLLLLPLLLFLLLLLLLLLLPAGRRARRRPLQPRLRGRRLLLLRC